MEDSLKASLQGLKLMDQARRAKRWNRQSSIWSQTALTSVATLKQFWRRERIQRDTFIRICEAVEISNWREIIDDKPSYPAIADWGEAPEAPTWQGRQPEIAQLTSKILDQRCKLVALLGLGGVGKTSLAVKWVEQMLPQFEYVIWRSLRSAPPLTELLSDLTQFLASPQPRPFGSRLRRLMGRRPETSPSEGTDPDPSGLLAMLLSQLREHRCLLILDQAETLLQPGSAQARLGEWQTGYADYGELLRRIGGERHLSCCLLISREPPKEIAAHTDPIYLAGLTGSEARHVLQQQDITGSEADLNDWVEYYAGNPAILSITGATIQTLYQGQAASFIQTLRQDGSWLAEIQAWWQDHFVRLSPPEQAVIGWLVLLPDPVGIPMLQASIQPTSAKSQLINTLESLKRRSILQVSGAGLSLDPVWLDYGRYWLAQQIEQELVTQTPCWLHSHSLSYSSHQFLKPLLERGNLESSLSFWQQQREVVASPDPAWSYLPDNLRLCLDELASLKAHASGDRR